MEIKKGDRFKCIKTVVNKDNKILYFKDKEYVSDMDNCITTCYDNINFSWGEKSSEEYFVKLNNNSMEDIKVGDVFKCIRTFRDFEGNEIYSLGKTYKSEEDNSITDNRGKKNRWYNSVSLYFVKETKVNTEDSTSDFKSITSQMVDTYTRKNHDYGNSFEQSLDKFGLVASVVRMGDKMNRIESLMKKEAKVKDESIKDTLLDLANYAIMTVMWMNKN